MANSPWASGPGEILQHGLSLLKKDSDVNRRLAMIVIDNAVELMIKIYLGLPSRITSIKLSREKYREISESFPKLLDAIEEHAKSKLAGLDLGEIEWYHRLRNELYHQGNGLTVERTNVEVYAELARVLFKNLFGFELIVKETGEMEILGAFIREWSRLEGLEGEFLEEYYARSPGELKGSQEWWGMAVAEGVIDAETVDQIEYFRSIRNSLSHGGVEDYSAFLNPEAIEELKEITSDLQRVIEGRSHASLSPPKKAAAKTRGRRSNT